eukprot:14802700-Alexandrium_andersonii.AAC.1
MQDEFLPSQTSVERGGFPGLSWPGVLTHAYMGSPRLIVAWLAVTLSGRRQAAALQAAAVDLLEAIVAQTGVSQLAGLAVRS